MCGNVGDKKCLEQKTVTESALPHPVLVACGDLPPKWLPFKQIRQCRVLAQRSYNRTSGFYCPPPKNSVALHASLAKRKGITYLKVLQV